MSSLTLFSVLLVILFASSQVAGHSWIACTDYNIASPNDANYWNAANCRGYARNWQSVATTTFGEDRGFNYQGNDGAPCRDPYSSSPYPTSYPMAQYSPGQTVCLAWPSKNHVAATCTNQYIPDTQLSLYALQTSGNTSPKQSDFTNGIVVSAELNGKHTNGVIDFKGFQNCSKFCENTDKSLCTGCFTVPSTFSSGVYTFQWYWIFNEGSPAYTTCWEAQIGGGSSNNNNGNSNNNSPAPSSSAQPMIFNPTVSASPNTNNNNNNNNNPSPAASASASPINNNNNNNGGGGVPLQKGDSLTIVSVPAQIPTTTGFPFTVTVDYTANGARWITVDILENEKNNPVWFGKGTFQIYSAGSGTADITVRFDDTAGNEIPPIGTQMILRAWIVDSAYWNTPQPWTYELMRTDASTVTGQYLMYTVSSSEGGIVVPGGVKNTDVEGEGITASGSSIRSFLAPILF